jgi:hypothetical protein
MKSFAIGPTTWPVLRLFSRNPLMRTSDRVEAAVTALAVFLVLVATACAGGRLRMARWHRDRGPMALLPPGVEENPQDR